MNASMLARLFLLICLLSTSGCGGHYILTVPDHIAPSAGRSVLVARLQRNDFFVLSLSVEDAALRFQVDGQNVRGAFTDEIGYAGTVFDAPDEPGEYRLTVAHQDFEGEEVERSAPLFVLNPDRDLIVVDLDCLPSARDKNVAYAVEAVGLAARRASVLYLTRRPISEHGSAHERIRRLGYPDGPILPWRRKRWHIVRSRRFKIPRVVFESRLESQLSVLRGMFDGLNVGITTSSIAAKAFADAGMRAVFIGQGDPQVANVTRRASWEEFAAAGL